MKKLLMIFFALMLVNTAAFAEGESETTCEDGVQMGRSQAANTDKSDGEVREVEPESTGSTGQTI